MNGFIAFCLALVSGSSSFAAMRSYDLKMDLSMDGKHVSSPRVITEEGSVASITQQADGKTYFIDVVASEEGAKGAINMKFVVGTVSDSGERTVVAEPTISALEKEKAEISVRDETSPARVSLSVVATRSRL